VIDGRVVVTDASSEIRARRIYREGDLPGRLGAREPSLPSPDVVAWNEEPAA